MAGRHGSRRNNNGVLKAVLIILTASLALAGITIAVFTRLGNRKNEQAQTTPSLEAPVPEPEKVEREIVSLEIPGTSTETKAVPTEAEDNTEAEAVPTETEDNAETEAVPTETEEVTETEAVPTETDNNTETTEPEETGSEEDLYAPAFLSFTNAPMIKAGDAFDIHKFVGYADDVDRDVEIAINGNIDVNTVGKYPVEIVLADDAGHVTSRSMEVNVLTEVPPSIPPETKSEAFSDFIAAYKTDQTSVGIDISRWQETVDFEKVKAAGCEFVYIRIGGLDDGELYTDRYYMNNIAGAKAQGLKVGIYWHAEESNAEEVKKSAAYLLNVLGSEQLDLPIAYDWEDFKNFENYKMNLYDINNNLQVFAAELAKSGYSSCLYSSKFFLENVWDSKNLPVWLAHYTKATSYPGSYFMWQHSCTGKIDGIAGAVDLDVLYNGQVDN